jgi:hypothetical protein
VTRYLVGNADPITLAILRWGIGFFFGSASNVPAPR